MFSIFLSKEIVKIPAGQIKCSLSDDKGRWNTIKDLLLIYRQKKKGWFWSLCGTQSYKDFSTLRSIFHRACPSFGTCYTSVSVTLQGFFMFWRVEFPQSFCCYLGITLGNTIAVLVLQRFVHAESILVAAWTVQWHKGLQGTNGSTDYCTLMRIDTVGIHTVCQEIL